MRLPKHRILFAGFVVLVLGMFAEDQSAGPAHSTGFVIRVLPRCVPSRNPRPTDYMGAMITIEISKSSELLINGDPVSPANLPNVLKFVFRKRLPQNIYLAVRDDVPYEKFIHILDSIAEIHLHGVVLLTKSSVLDMSNEMCLFDFGR